MLLIPSRRIGNNINDIKEFAELKRNIIIYIKDIGLSYECPISINNICVQNGSVGALQSNSELLYSMNMYYGTIKNPLFYTEDIAKPILNKDAEVRIDEYAYSYKLVDKVNETEETKNYINQIISGDYVNYGHTDDEESEIVPCDPRYYTIDHQILVTDVDTAYYVDYDNILCYDQIARKYGGIGYTLNQLLDENTHIYISKVHIDDPYLLLKKDYKISQLIDSVVCEIQNYALLALLASYRIILDFEYGYNIFDIHRSFKKMDKMNEMFEVANFYEVIKESYEKLKDSNIRIRMTIIYDKAQTNISIVPLIPNEKKVIQSLSNKNMYDFMLDHCN